MRKKFRHLSKSEIKDIIVLHKQSVPKLHIAEQLNVDNSTVHYHINKYERTVGDIESGDFYSIMKVGIRAECRHTSLKCSCCGKYEDLINTERYQKIIDLEDIIRRYKSKYGEL